MKPQKKNTKAEKDEPPILVEPSKFVNFALRNGCDKVDDHGNEPLIKLVNKNDRSCWMYINPYKQMSLHQAQLDCIRMLKISTMSREDWED